MPLSIPMTVVIGRQLATQYAHVFGEQGYSYQSLSHFLHRGGTKHRQRVEGEYAAGSRGAWGQALGVLTGFGLFDMSCRDAPQPSDACDPPNLGLIFALPDLDCGAHGRSRSVAYTVTVHRASCVVHSTAFVVDNTAFVIHSIAFVVHGTPFGSTIARIPPARNNGWWAAGG